MYRRWAAAPTCDLSLVKDLVSFSVGSSCNRRASLRRALCIASAARVRVEAAVCQKSCNRCAHAAPSGCLRPDISQQFTTSSQHRVLLCSGVRAYVAAWLQLEPPLCALLPGCSTCHDRAAAPRQRRGIASVAALRIHSGETRLLHIRVGR